MSAGKVDVVLGIQWGDEGKGRVVDGLANEYDVVARFGGGDNAGHTLVVGDRKLALRIVPSGVLQPKPELLIGGGTVVSLRGFVDELDMLRGVGVDVGRIVVSDRAHVVFPYHTALDRANEQARGAAKIGTTGRGIGPAYTDRVSRDGVTFGDLRDEAALIDRVRRTYRARAAQFAALEDAPREDDVVAHTRELLPRVLPHVVDGVAFVHDRLEAGRTILAEGAQGTLLDIGYGSYPFVTSSHTIAGGACTGLGIGPTAIARVTGVVKAYCSRVGSGPFPSELHDAHGDLLRSRGREYGTVTGRPRRCGWFDAVAARYAVRLNGLSSAILTKLDVLSTFEKVAIVRGYSLDGSPAGFEAAAHPGLDLELEWYDGWNEDLGAVRRIGDLPAAARRYVTALRESLGVPIDAVSVGPERDQLALP